jgi:integral membrane protein (TIGR01906 family)
MRIVGIVGRWLFIICLPVLLLTATIAGLVNSLWLYNYGFRAYGVSESLAVHGLQLSDSELEGVYAGLISYYHSGEEYVDITVVSGGETVDLFSPEEVSHFRDVKGLIWLDYWVLPGALVYALSYAGLSLFWWKDRRLLARGLLGGGIFTLGLLVILALLGVLFGFGELFNWFHLLFFTNPTWHAEGYMLILFPEEFFAFASALGAGIIAAVAVILGVVGWYLRRLKNET